MVAPWNRTQGIFVVGGQAGDIIAFTDSFDAIGTDKFQIMNKYVICSLYLILSVYYVNSSHYANCQSLNTDSFFTENQIIGKMNCEILHPGMVVDGKTSNQIGFQYYEKGDYANAIGYYIKAIALSPEYPVPRNNLGVIYLKSNELELARECFSEAIALNPEYVKAICNLAIVSYKLGDLNSATQLYHAAERIDSSYVQQRIANYMNQNK